MVLSAVYLSKHEMEMGICRMPLSARREQAEWYFQSSDYSAKGGAQCDYTQ